MRNGTRPLIALGGSTLVRSQALPLMVLASMVLASMGCSFKGAAGEGESGALDSGLVDSSVSQDAILVETDSSSLPACFSTYNDLVFGNVRYRFPEDFLSFDDASAACEVDGGRLATLETSAELDAVSAYLSANNIGIGCLGGCGWVGLSQQSGATEPDGGWRWTDNSTFDDAHWNTLEPNNILLAEDCGQLIGGGLNDLGCEIVLRGVCECQPI